MYRVLTIDDDPTILRAYREIHRRESESPVDQLLVLERDSAEEGGCREVKEQINFSIEISNSGEEGLQMVRDAIETNNPYAVIYLDMRMPGRWNGTETAREIRSIDQDVRILVVTAYSEDIEKLYEIIGDAFVYLKKPFVKEELIQLTRFLAQDWRRSRQQRLREREWMDLSEAKSQFLSIISHELRTPLTTLMGNGDLLLDLLQHGTERELLQDMMRSGQTLQRLYDELFDAAQIQSRLIALDASPFDLGQLLNTLEQYFTQLAEQGGLEFSLENGVPLEHYFVGDSKRLQQVLSKLLTNAVKFTEYGSVKLRVSRQAQENLQFIVEDTGCGMPAEMVATLSEPFRQIEMNNSRSHGGMGLGLYICSGLVNQMDGMIECSTVLGKGTRITLNVPLQLGEPLPVISMDEQQQEQCRARFLLMDDALEMQALLTRYFNQIGVDLVCASDGAEGISKAMHEGPFNLLLIDLRMPNMDGLEATRRLREQGVKTPIIMLGAECTDEYRTAAKEAGAYSMLPKPLSPTMLQQLVSLYSF